MQKIKYIDLFAGIGGFTKAIQDILGDKAECIGYSEIDPYAIQIYNKHFNHKNYGDITKINEKELPEFEILIGGFPCQSFSIAGKRGGFDDTRGTLFFEIARIIREKQPRLLLFENVKGLLSHDKGNTFFTIISTLDELGYDCQWQVLNSKNFGVPQNRERVFIVGHLRGTSRPEVFPLGGTNSATTFSKTIRAGGKGSISKKHAWDLIQINKPKHSNDRVYSEKGISPTLNTMQGGNRQPFIKLNKKGTKKKDQNNASCLTGGGHSGGNHSDMDLILERKKDKLGRLMPLHRKKRMIRRLTPKECERLQGFPDDWTSMGLKEKFNLKISGDEVKHYIEISDSQRYKVLGNAVTVNVIKAIINKLI